jgi:cobalt-zinc-cadmium resistance protein CzcA
MQQLIAFFLKKPGLVMVLTLFIISAGIYEYKTMPVDAFPDISPVMVPIFCESHGMAPEEMERLITWPIESVMNGLPGVVEIKSTSAFGLSVVYVYFSDKTDIFFARQLVSERLTSVSAELPNLETPPTLGPISTGLGQIFIYYLTADPDKVDTAGKDVNTWLRELNDWVVKYQLQTVKGVTAVLSMGGHVLQYQIKLDPDKMVKYQLSLEEIVNAVQSNNRNAGGQFLVLGSEEHLVRGIGLVQSLEELRRIPVKVVHSNPVLLHDIADIEFGNEVRRGSVTRNGESEVVSGIVMKLYGENTSEVIKRLHDKIGQIKKMLPPGVGLVPYYDQAELVNNATSTVVSSLLQGSVLIVLILLVFMGNLRSALLVMLSLPLCAFIALLLMGTEWPFCQSYVIGRDCNCDWNAL